MISEYIKKVRIVKEFWYEGRHFKENECISLPINLIKLIGSEMFEECKSLDKPVRDKMIHNPYSKK